MVLVKFVYDVTEFRIIGVDLMYDFDMFLQCNARCWNACLFCDDLGCQIMPKSCTRHAEKSYMHHKKGMSAPTVFRSQFAVAS